MALLFSSFSTELGIDGTWHGMEDRKYNLDKWTDELTLVKRFLYLFNKIL